MEKIFGISKLPVSGSFPSVEGGKSCVNACASRITQAFTKAKPDVYVSRTKIPQDTLKSHLSKFFHRKHTKV